MLLVQLTQDLANQLDALTYWADGSHWSHLQSAIDWSVLAQKQFDTDVFANTRAWFANFIESGQVWALIIGFVVGYILRSLTSYG